MSDFLKITDNVLSYFRKKSMDEPLNGLLLLILTVLTLVGLSWFWVRRNFFPIKPRKPYLVISTSLGYFSVIMLNTLPRNFPENAGKYCLIPRIIAPFFFHLTLQLSVLRVFLLFYWDLITQAGVRYYYRDSTEMLRVRQYDSLGKFFLWNRHKLSDAIFLLGSILIGLLFFLASLILSLPRLLPLGILHEDANGKLCNRYKVNNLVVSLVHTVFAVVFQLSFLFYALRNVEENLYFKKEFSGIAFGFVFYILMLLTSILGKFYIFGLDLEVFLVAFLPNITLLILAIYRVLFWSYRNMPTEVPKDLASSSNERRHVVHSILQDFKEVLHDPKGFQILLEFCQKDFCAENVLFLKECSEFTRTERRWPLGKRIYEEFIATDSKLPVNISVECRQRLDITFQNNAQQEEEESALAANIFEDAEKEITNLLLFDCFVRLRLSSSYRQWKDPPPATSLPIIASVLVMKDS